MNLELFGILPVINRRNTAELKHHASISVSRPSPLSNPFRIDDARDRREAIAAFERWFLPRLSVTPTQPSTVQRTAVAVIAERLIAGERVALFCWCAPEPCHGAIVRREVLRYAVSLLDTLAPEERGRNETALREAFAGCAKS